MTESEMKEINNKVQIFAAANKSLFEIMKYHNRLIDEKELENARLIAGKETTQDNL